MTKRSVSLAIVLSMALTLISGIVPMMASAQDAEPVKLVYYFKPVSDGNEQSTEAGLKAVHDRILADTGVDLQVIMGSKNDDDHTTKLNLLLSSGEQVDIFLDPWQPLYLKGFVADLTDYIEADPKAQEALARFRPETLKSVMPEEGKIVAFPWDDAGSTFPVWLRKDLLDKCGLEVPTTIDELEAVLRAFKEQDPVGDGKTMGMVTSIRGIGHAFVGAFTEHGMGRFEDAADGRIKPYFMDPGYKDFIDRMAGWYKDGLIAPETFSYIRADVVNFINQGQVASFADWYSMVTLSDYTFKANFPDGEYVFLDGLTGPKGYAESIWPQIKPSVGERSGDGLMVNANCKDIAAALRVISWGYLNSPYNFITAFQGIQDVNWEWVDEETATYQLIDNPEQQYLGEYNMFMCLVNELAVQSMDPTRLYHNEWLREGWYRYDHVKWPVEMYFVYNDQMLKDEVPNYQDIMLYVQEQMVSFITGARPLDQWDSYMNDLQGMGVEQMIDAYTKQFKGGV